MIKRINLAKVLIGIALLSLSIFIYGFLKEVGIGHPVLYVLLTTALFFKIIKVLFEWYHYGGVSEIKTKHDDSEKKTSYSVDMFTTACPGEPFEMFEETLRAMVAVGYPHKNYLCDEGNDPELRKLCEDLGVIHMTRSSRENAKAGNVNNALKQSSGEICVILDPDHAPYPDFLDQVLQHFEDPEVGYVQVVQAYKNQVETFVARAAAEQTYLFYGPMMRAMGKYGTSQAIGANCTFRRKALDSIGGHAPGLTEDMHTSMLLHAKGWKSIYVPKIVSRGLVPSSLSAYYKQQLKWSRGTFDLWFHLFPKLFKEFTWRQRIHYGLMPVYYLFGLITLIDIFVPLYSLLTGEYPWLLNPMIFFAYFTPFLVCSLIVRLYSQRWLHDNFEQGLHLFGGILRVGSWWVYLVGLIYTFLNIKVPYIPTPKEHTSKNEFLLGLPNLLVSIICIAAAVYGLNQDWQPYSILMAAFAISNALIFFLAFAIGQSRWVLAIRDFYKDLRRMRWISNIDLSYHKFSRIGTPLIIIFIVIFSSFFIPNPYEDEKDVFGKNEKANIDKNIGGFYTGIYFPSEDGVLEMDKINIATKTVDSWSIISTYLSWGDEPIPTEEWRSIINNRSIPMITWEPYSNLFSEYSDHPDISRNRRIFHHIREGCFDAYIDRMALAIRDLDSPIFLRFAHEMDNPMYPWSSTGGNEPEEFVEAWKYLHQRFDALGVDNVSWIWNPWSVSNMEVYFPYGQQNSVDQFVDWIGLTVLNYANASSNQTSQSFDDIFLPFREQIGKLKLELPVMISEFGSTSYGVDGADWNQKSLKEIQDYYPEIKSVVLFYSNLDKNWINNWRPDNGDQLINWKFNLSSISTVLGKFEKPEISDLDFQKLAASSNKNKNIKGSLGNFSWSVDNNDFYIKGISYNTGHDWHDGFYPLNRRQLTTDFKNIKALGANTIRRYEPGIYDRNILKVAEEYDLKIMYGFWFDPSIDYYNDQEAIEKYEEKVLAYVLKYKNQKQIIAWNIGNETWGLLKKHFAKPYLTLNRMAYLNFLENLAQKIHAIDPERPVFSSEEHDHLRLIATIQGFKRFAPSLDAIGINTYYEENIQDLNELFTQIDSNRPYAVTEFGPKGYWSKEFGDFRSDSLLIEVSSLSKAQWYEKQWNDYIISNAGFNLGGFAFSWRDRYEGTATWFGITDYKGRLKPSYYYLQRAWNGNVISKDQFPDISIVGHWHALSPGEKIWFSAANTAGYDGKLVYEWEVFEDQTWKKLSPITNSLLDEQFVEVQLPTRTSSYRIYVHATDTLGNVITASRPLIMK